MSAALQTQYNLHSFLSVAESQRTRVDASESSTSEHRPADGHKRSKACGKREHEACWSRHEWAVSYPQNCRVSLAARPYKEECLNSPKICKNLSFADVTSRLTRASPAPPNSTSHRNTATRCFRVSHASVPVTSRWYQLAVTSSKFVTCVR